MILICACLSTLLKGKQRNNSSIFLPRFFPLGKSQFIGSNPLMGSIRAQPKNYENTITLHTKMVRLSSISTFVSPSCIIKFLNLFSPRTKTLLCITIMLYLPLIDIGLKKNLLTILVSLCILVQSMKNNLKEQVFPKETQLNKQTCLLSYSLYRI